MDHEILTDRGFCSFSQLDSAIRLRKQRVRVAAYDAARDAIVFETPTALIFNPPRNDDAPTDETMVEIYSPLDSGVSLLVTPDHRMLAAGPDGVFQKTLAKSLVGNLSFIAPLAAANGLQQSCSAVSQEEETLLELFGYWHNSANHWRNAPPPFVAQRLALLPQMVGESSVFRQSFGEKSVFASWVFELDAPRSRAVLRGMAAAGACEVFSPTFGERMTIETALEAVREAAARLAVQAGWSAKQQHFANGFRILLSCNARAELRARTVAAAEGGSWCVSTPSGAIVVRRNKINNYALSANGLPNLPSRPVIVGNCDDHGNKVWQTVCGMFVFLFCFSSRGRFWSTGWAT
jgi:hypothetical protein